MFECICNGPHPNIPSTLRVTIQYPPDYQKPDHGTPMCWAVRVRDGAETPKYPATYVGSGVWSCDVDLGSIYEPDTAYVVKADDGNYQDEDECRTDALTESHRHREANVG